MKARPLLLATFGVVLVAVLGRTTFSLNEINAVASKIESNATIEQAIERSIAEALALALDTETGIRGFALTDSPQFLEPYQRAVRERNTVLAQLKVRLDDPESAALAEAFRSEYLAWDARIAQPLLNSQDLPPAARLRLHAEGKERMDALRQIVAKMQSQLAVRRQASIHQLREYQAEFANQLWAMAGLMTVMLGFLALLIVRKIERPIEKLVAHTRNVISGELAPIELTNGVRELRELGSAISTMVISLANERRRESKFGELMAALSGGGKASSLAEVALNSLVSEHGNWAGALWLGEPGEPLRCVATYALDSVALSRESELARQVWERKEQVFLAELPRQSKHVVRSAFVDVVPKSLLAVPLFAGGTPIGVVELAGDIQLEAVQQDLQRLLPRIGLALQNALSLEKMSAIRAQLVRMNEELQAQNEELSAQEETLRTQSEELNSKQKQLHQRNEELARASHHKTEFLSNASHELRTPLNAIIGFSDLLLNQALGPLSDKQRGAVEDVAAAGTQLLNLVNDLLDLSRIEAGRLALDIRAADLAGPIAQAAAHVEALALRKGVKLENRVAADAIWVNVDTRRTLQIITNLLANAIRFTPEAGSVAISASVEQESARIEVVDTGIGISERDQMRLFLPFEQAEPGKSGGTGLGLSISKVLVELMGGKIGAESVPGKGSTFYVLLPLAKRRVEMAWRETRSPEQRLAIAQRSVLLVEDASSDAQIAELLLKRQGYEVRLATSAERALELLAEKVPDVLIVDLVLPGMSGFSLIERVRADLRTQTLPIAVLTARDLSAGEQELLVSAADLVAQKGMMTGAGFVDAIDNLRRRERRKAKIVVVDDNEANQRLLATLLTTSGYEIQLFADAESALEAIRFVPPDLVLMDVRLPGMDGLEATRRLKAQPRLADIPVIAVSAQAMVGDRERALAAGCSAYVTKPVARQELIEAINRVVCP